MNKRGTFNLPDFQDRVIQGSGTRGNVGTYKAESLPNINGEFASYQADGILKPTNICKGVFYQGTQRGNSYVGKVDTGYDLGFDASRSSSVYQTNAPVQQNALLIQCCIKY